MRDNILFGKEYDPEFYQKVVEGCCLVDDFKNLANGDMTEIEEKGINLSGGQKTRVSLARAVYSQSDIYLLDDPLSAVDSKVAKRLYENAIQGLLKDKTVLLVTHQVHFIKSLERIVVMDQGAVIGQGSYEELIKQNIDVKIFVETRKARKQEPQTQLNFSAPINNDQKLDEDEEGVDGEEVIDDKGKLFSTEDLHAGNVTTKTYVKYFKSIFNLPTLIIFVILLASCEVASVAYGRLLGYWASGLIEENTSQLVCGLLAFGILFFYVCKHVSWVYLALAGAKKLHNRMIEKIVRSPVEFFDTNPVGRILNRFSNDLGIVDRLLLSSTYDVIEGMFYFTALFVTIWIINPLIIIPCVGGAVLYLFILRFNVKGIKNSKGLELVTRSPIYSLFSLTLAGLITVRSYKQSNNFISKFLGYLRDNGKAGLYYWNVTRIMAFSIDLTSSVYIITGLCIIIATRNSDTALSGLAASYLLSVSEYMQWILRQMINTDMLMASCARVMTYGDLKCEPEVTLPSDSSIIQKGWPSKGEVEFKNVYMKYRANTDHVIKNLNLKIHPGEKIGCVGRTGAGKSSIIQMLFRMVEIDKSTDDLKQSSICIDGIDTQGLGLHALRNSISIIPQAPVVFTGSIRRNLDPLHEYTTEELWYALDEVGLKPYIDSLPDKLDTDMTNATSVFSVGQKQLICLARAILKKNKIIVLDEATANVDFQTDSFIQKKIMEKFKDCTVFTIAHRLSTIANYDKVLVLDKGRCVEFDAPYKLLVKEIGDDSITNTEGVFASMVLHTGPKNSHFIFEICKNKYMFNS